MPLMIWVVVFHVTAAVPLTVNGPMRTVPEAVTMAPFCVMELAESSRSSHTVRRVRVPLMFTVNDRAGESRDTPGLEIMRALKAELRPSRLVMVGDGVSDLETKPEVDLFVGFGRYVERPKVKANAAAFIHSLGELLPLLK